MVAAAYLAGAGDERSQRHLELGGVAFHRNQELRGAKVLHQKHARACDGGDKSIVGLTVQWARNPGSLPIDHERALLEGKCCTIGRGERSGTVQIAAHSRALHPCRRCVDIALLNSNVARMHLTSVTACG